MPDYQAGYAYSCNLHKTNKFFKYKNPVVIPLGVLLPPSGFTLDMNIPHKGIVNIFSSLCPSVRFNLSELSLLLSREQMSVLLVPACRMVHTVSPRVLRA